MNKKYVDRSSHYQFEGSASNLVGRAGENLLSSSKYFAICGPRKVKVKVKFTIEQATKAHRGSRGIALLVP